MENLTNDQLKQAVDSWRNSKDGKEPEPEKDGALNVEKTIDNWLSFNKNKSSNHGK